jgi:Mrp family chromosome partitioning ATPase
MGLRPVEILAFISLKGGVGKSTLAVAAALERAAGDQRVLLVDGDITGTSLADALPLRAPDGRGGWLSREETLESRAAPREQLEQRVAPDAPYYFNDVLAARRENRRANSSDGPLLQSPPLEQCTWMLDGAPRLLVVPSSSLSLDVGGSLEWIAEYPDL